MFRHEAYTKLTIQITEAVSTEKIFLLATTNIQYEAKGVFIGVPVKPVKSIHYHVLVLVPSKRFIDYASQQEKVELACYRAGLVTALVMGIDQFNEWLRQGHFFAVPVKEEGTLIYDKGDIPLVKHKPIDMAFAIEESSIAYSEGIERMQQLMDKNKLHAGAVCGLQTIIKAGTGLEVKTTDLDKLVRHASLLIKEIPAFFPSSSSDLTHFSRKLLALLRLTAFADMQILPR